MNDIIKEVTDKNDKRTYERTKKIAASSELSPEIRYEAEHIDLSKCKETMCSLIQKDIDHVLNWRIE